MSNAQPIFFFLFILAFVVVFYWPWQRLCVSWTRQLMFEERDRLFLLARSNKHMPLDSALHIEFRRMIDRNIQYCHQVKWPNLLVLVWTQELRKSTDKFRAGRLSKLVDEVSDPRLKSELRGIMLRMVFACIVCLMGRSLILGPIFLGLYLVSLLRDTRESNTTQSIFDTVQYGAENERPGYVKAGG